MHCFQSIVGRARMIFCKRQTSSSFASVVHLHLSLQIKSPLTGWVRNLQNIQTSFPFAMLSQTSTLHVLLLSSPPHPYPRPSNCEKVPPPKCARLTSYHTELNLLDFVTHVSPSCTSAVFRVCKYACRKRSVFFLVDIIFSRKMHMHF